MPLGVMPGQTGEVRLGGGGLRVLALSGSLLWVSPQSATERWQLCGLHCDITGRLLEGPANPPPPPERLGFKGVCPGEERVAQADGPAVALRGGRGCRVAWEWDVPCDAGEGLAQAVHSRASAGRPPSPGSASASPKAQV